MTPIKPLTKKEMKTLHNEIIVGVPVSHSAK
jgi:hypothetical protein